MTKLSWAQETQNVTVNRDSLPSVETLSVYSNSNQICPRTLKKSWLLKEIRLRPSSSQEWHKTQQTQTLLCTWTSTTNRRWWSWFRRLRTSAPRNNKQSQDFLVSFNWDSDHSRIHTMFSTHCTSRKYFWFSILVCQISCCLSVIWNLICSTEWKFINLWIEEQKLKRQIKPKTIFSHLLRLIQQETFFACL